MYMFFLCVVGVGVYAKPERRKIKGRGKLIYAFRYSVNSAEKRRTGKEGGEQQIDQKSSTRDLRTGKERLKNVKSR